MEIKWRSHKVNSIYKKSNSRKGRKRKRNRKTEGKRRKTKKKDAKWIDSILNTENQKKINDEYNENILKKPEILLAKSYINKIDILIFVFGIIFFCIFILKYLINSFLLNCFLFFQKIFLLFS